MSTRLLRLPCRILTLSDKLHSPLFEWDGRLNTSFPLEYLPNIPYNNPIELIFVLFHPRHIWHVSSLTFAYMIIFSFEPFLLSKFLYQDNRKHPRLRKIVPANGFIRSNIRKTSYSEPICWVVQLNDREYMGLTRSGPRIMSK